MSVPVLATDRIKSFTSSIREHGIILARQHNISTLQVNIGKRCNQACHHCHVESGPNRTENMTLDTINRLLILLAKTPRIHTVDITGGAPEMNPHFKHFVKGIRALGKEVIDRCNLTILYEPNQENTAQFLADNQVKIVASLPCYSEDNVDSQRGKGVFEKSIDALQLFNQLGYGIPGSDLELNLVYNPQGINLPPEQKSLQAAYKVELKKQFNIEFNQLFTITNMPIKRFAHELQREGTWQEYMQLLIDHFNPQAANAVMCKDLVSIGYDGTIYDCDFNQMLDIQQNHHRLTIWDIEQLDDIPQEIATADHCYACTAGSGSSCSGTIVD